MYYSLSLARAGRFDHLNANCSSNIAETQTKLIHTDKSALLQIQ